LTKFDGTGKGFTAIAIACISFAGFPVIAMALVAMRKGVKFTAILWVIFSHYLQGFQVIAMALVAICKGFKATAIVCISFGCYLQGFQVIAIALFAIDKGFR